MGKKILILLVATVAALGFAGVRPSDVKQKIDALSQQSSDSVMGPSDDYWGS